MIVFPQLVTGASALYPVLKARWKRTVVNVLGDGSTDVFSDNDAALVEWELHATGMTGAEWNAIDSLLQQVSGRWQTFTFLDPTSNLLAESETLSSSAWTKGALVGLTAGVVDPLGTTRATTLTNTGSSVAGISQVLPVPGNFQYCLSAWIRSSGGSSVTLSAGTNSQSVSTSAVWSRVALAAGGGSSSASTVIFGLQLPIGGAADVFGLQAEAQLAPSDYKVTGVSGGVYPQARFALDQIPVTARGTDVYDAVIRIVSPENT
jgi:LysM repeat protein